VPQGNVVLNGVEAAQARDPTEAIRAMEAELEERRRIEAMLKVRFLGVMRYLSSDLQYMRINVTGQICKQGKQM
jgi:hypothetical protein